MIADLKPYPAMKDSGVPWLGEVPAHWTIKRLKYLFREVDERSVSGEEELLSVSHITGVTSRREKNVTMFLAESNVGHKICRTDDLVVNTMWAWMAALGVSRQVGLVSPAYGVYRPIRSSPISPKYVEVLLRTSIYASEYLRRSTGVNSSRLRLYPDQFLGIPLVCPPADEQVAIVRFLDHADRRIRRYIRAKRKLIKLLEEQKQAIIHRAVTHGLDPNVRLKASGVPWLGNMPANWELEKIKNLARPGYKTFVDGDWIESPYITSDGIRLIQTGNVGVGAYREKGYRYVSEDTFRALGCTEFHPGDVLICRLGEPVGRACLAPDLGGRMITSVDVCILKPREGVLPAFVVYAMSSSQFLRWVNSLVRGSTRDRVSRSMLGSFAIALPPAPEQAAIVSYLHETTAGITGAIDRVLKETTLLREYRTRLIADVVTGKLDVRAASANLPDDVDEREAPDDTDALAVGDEAADGDLEAVPEDIEA